MRVEGGERREYRRLRASCRRWPSPPPTGSALPARVMAMGVTCLREIGIFLLVSFEILVLGSELLSGFVQANVSPVIDGCLWMGYS